MGLAATLRNFWDPPEYRGVATPKLASGWDALELNGRQVNVRLLSLKAAGDPANEPASLIDLGRGGSVAWTDTELNTHIREAFRVSGLVFRCLTIIADAFAEGVLRIYRDIDGQSEEVPDHELRLLISEPNPEQSEAEFWTTLLLIMGMNGYGLVEKVRSLTGQVVRLYPRNPESFRRKVLQDQSVVWEHRVAGALVRTIPDADILVVPYQFDPALKRLGITPIHVLGREIGIDTNLSSYLKLYLDEGGVPPFVLISKDPIADQSEVEQIQEQWRQKYGGGKSWGTIPVLHGGYELHEIAADLDKMAWPDLRGVNELRIAQGMGVPAHLIGAREAIANGGLATTEMQQAMRFFQLYTIQALRNRVDGAFTRGLLRESEPDRTVSLGFDISGILALQEDEDRKATRVRSDMQASIITLEEAREARGYEPQPAKGETFLRPFSVSEVVAGTPVPDATPNDTAPKSERRSGLRPRNLKAMSSRELEIRASLVDRNRKSQTKLTSLSERLLRKFWKEQGDRITAAALKSDVSIIRRDIDAVITRLSDLKPVTKSDGCGSRGSVMNPFYSASFDHSWAKGSKAIADLDLIDWEEEENLLRSLMDKFYATAGELAAADASATLGVQIDWALSNPNIQRTMGMLSKRIVGINETTRLDVSKVIADSLTEGVTLDELAGRLDGMFAETYKGRAMTVARTESMYSYSMSSLRSYEESGVIESVEFADNPDHDTDPMPPTDTTCADRNGHETELGKASDYVDSAHPNCILAVLPIVKLGDG